MKPVLSVVDGVVDVHKKVRGLGQALEAMRDGDPRGHGARQDRLPALAHGLNEELLGAVAPACWRKCTDRDFQIRFTTIVGAVIGTYAGPGAVAVAAIQE